MLSRRRYILHLSHHKYCLISNVTFQHLSTSIIIHRLSSPTIVALARVNNVIMAASCCSPSIDRASTKAISASQPRKSAPSEPEDTQNADSSCVIHSTSSSTRLGRSQSLVCRTGKRLSLNFPVQPHGNNQTRHTPS